MTAAIRASAMRRCASSKLIVPASCSTQIPEKIFALASCRRQPSFDGSSPNVAKLPRGRLSLVGADLRRMRSASSARPRVISCFFSRSGWKNREGESIYAHLRPPPATGDYAVFGL